MDFHLPLRKALSQEASNRNTFSPELARWHVFSYGLPCRQRRGSLPADQGEQAPKQPEDVFRRVHCGGRIAPNKRGTPAPIYMRRCDSEPSRPALVRRLLRLRLSRLLSSDAKATTAKPNILNSRADPVSIHSA
jgi:hypothetical protein